MDFSSFISLSFIIGNVHAFVLNKVENCGEQNINNNKKCATRKAVKHKQENNFVSVIMLIPIVKPAYITSEITSCTHTSETFCIELSSEPAFCIL